MITTHFTLRRDMGARMFNTSDQSGILEKIGELRSRTTVEMPYWHRKQPFNVRRKRAFIHQHTPFLTKHLLSNYEIPRPFNHCLCML